MESEYKNNISYIAKQIKDSLAEYEYTDIEITDMLVKYLYGIKDSKYKEALWFCYGNVVVDNLKRNIGDKTSVCAKCGKRYHKELPAQKYCENCNNTYEKIEIKKIICIDCGKEFEVDGNVNRKRRCDECQRKKQLEYQRNSMKKLRNVK